MNEVIHAIVSVGRVHALFELKNTPKGVTSTYLGKFNTLLSLRMKYPKAEFFNASDIVKRIEQNG